MHADNTLPIRCLYAANTLPIRCQYAAVGSGDESQDKFFYAQAAARNRKGKQPGGGRVLIDALHNTSMVGYYVRMLSSMIL